VPVLAAALGRPAPQGPVPGTAAGLVPILAALVDAADPAQAWLALAVLSGELPTEEVVQEAARSGELDGGLALAAAVASATTARSVPGRVIVSAGVLVDVDHTVGAAFTTGIQRVVRETAGRWAADGRGQPVAWTEGHRALRELTPAERAAVLDRRPVPGSGAVRPAATTVVVPWGGAYLLPELALELPRVDRVRALARYARVRTGAIGYDCVPVTSAETVALGIGNFARNLAALKHVDRLTTISRAAAGEYGGWRAMLAGSGLAGPLIEPIILPATAPGTSEQALTAVARRLTPDDRALVVVVGSNEPRKNHLAVLHAAELLRARGLDFRLVFLGGRGWGSEGFLDRVEQLRAGGMPVEVWRGASDEELSAAYRLARFSVFPSLNEGYGLPVAESLACGTPVITSDFGSMREIAEAGGALLVDPRDDHAIAAAMERLLLDDAVHATLRRQAQDRPVGTWDDYADAVWRFLAGDAGSESGTRAPAAEPGR